MLVHGARRDAELQAFVADVRSFAVTVNFASLGELKTQITNALRTWALRTGRSARLRPVEVSPAAEDKPETGELGGIKVVLDDEGPTLVTDVLERAREDVEAGRTENALDATWSIAQDAYDIGLSWVTSAMLDRLDEFLPLARVDDRWRGWLLNTRGLALGARERHDEARAAFEQARQLGRALKDPDLESTALQNLGVQAIHADEHETARAFLVRSFELKKSIEDWRGAIQVMFNMFNVLLSTDELDRAARLLEDLDELLRVVRDPLLRNTLHGNAGRLAVARGDLDLAQKEFSAALRAARRASSLPRTIGSMQSLGTLASKRGHPGRAKPWYAQALELADSIDDVAQRRTQRSGLAVTLMRLGDHQKAAELFEQVAAESQGLGDSRGAATALADAGACLLNAGDPLGARELTERALAMPGSDDGWRASQLANLAYELAAMDEHDAALQRLIEAANLQVEALERAAGLREAAEFAAGVPALGQRAAELFSEELELRRRHEPSNRWAWRAAEIGATMAQSDEAGRAREFFSIALRVFARSTDRRQAFFVRNDRALASARLGDLAPAAADLRACLALAEEMDDRALLQQAHMNLGEIERRRARDETASGHLAAALRLAIELEDLRQEGETRSLLALHFMDTDDDASAFAELAALDEIANRLGDGELRAQTVKIRAHLAFKHGRYAESARLYGRAARWYEHDDPAQFVESLGGQVVSAAFRGRIEEDALQRLVDLSSTLRWDGHLLGNLDLAFRGLVETGAPEQVADIAAVSLVIAARDGANTESETVEEEGEDLGEEMKPLLITAFRVALWLTAEDDEEPHAHRRALVDAALVETVGSEIAANLAPLLDQAVEVANDTQPVDPANAP
jgi:tetratricopeptide (TPR) repeat protein